jgi:DNA-binding transcriptional LysR family regulator
MQDPLPGFASWTNRLRLRHLAMLLNISRHSSLTAAAKAMNMSQPAVSQWLGDIESALGVTLYVRGRRLRPTPYAEILIRHAQVMLGESRRLHEEITALQSGSVGIVRIGTLLVTAAGLIPEAMLQLKKDAPELQMTVVEDININLLARFERNELDIVVGRLDAGMLAAGYKCEPLLEDRFCVICGPDHPLTKKRKPNWQDAQRFPWILPPSGTPLRQSIETTFAASGLPCPSPWVESTSITTNMALMRQSHCLAISSATAANYYQSFGIIRALPMALTNQSSPVGMMWREESQSPKIGLVLKTLRNCAGMGR